MATTGNGVWTPDASSNYNLVTDLAAMAASIDTALVKSANAYKGTAAQREAFTAAPDGTLWSDTNGTRQLWMRQSGAWVVANSPTDTGWIPITLNAPYTQQGPLPMSVRRIGDVVYPRWGVSNTGLTSAGTYSIGTVPVGFRPVDADYYGPLVTNINGLLGRVSVSRSTGVIQLQISGVAANYYLWSVPWLAS